MATQRIAFERLKTYLFGVAIGSVLVAMILVTKAGLVRRQQAGNQTPPAQAAPIAPDNKP